MIVVIANGNLEANYVIDTFKEDRRNKIIVINSNKDVADYLVKHQHVSVYVGNPWRTYALEEANIYDADLFISLSDNDTDNYVSCILAKKIFNVRKCICLVKNPDNVEIYKKLGIDSVISSTYLLTQNIKTESLEGNLIRSMNLDANKIVMVEATLLSRYRICNKAIMNINFPSYANIAYIMRDGEFIIPKGNVVLKPRDTLVITCKKDDEKELTKYIMARASARDIEKNIANQVQKTLSNISEVKKEQTPVSIETKKEDLIETKTDSEKKAEKPEVAVTEEVKTDAKEKKSASTSKSTSSNKTPSKSKSVQKTTTEKATPKSDAPAKKKK